MIRSTVEKILILSRETLEKVDPPSFVLISGGNRSSGLLEVKVLALSGRWRVREVKGTPSLGTHLFPRLTFTPSPTLLGCDRTLTGTTTRV